jgi:hypothetical protein
MVEHKSLSKITFEDTLPGSELECGCPVPGFIVQNPADFLILTPGRVEGILTPTGVRECVYFPPSGRSSNLLNRSKKLGRSYLEGRVHIS